ncbi:hypothetical protein ACCS65_36435, partial [Rhizobium ruizarguesonis]
VDQKRPDMAAVERDCIFATIGKGRRYRCDPAVLDQNIDEGGTVPVYLSTTRHVSCKQRDRDARLRKTNALLSRQTGGKGGKQGKIVHGG